MEKYHDWRDAFTGIHPFLPAKSSWSVLGLLVVVVRLPVAAALLVVVLAADALLPFLRSLWAWLLVRPLLLVCGMSVSVSQSGRPGTGSVVFITHKSYWDVLVCGAVFVPSYFVHVFGSRVVVHSSLLSALLFVAVAKSPSCRASASLSQLKQLRGRVVCFVEGATSNHEKCVLGLDASLAPAIDALGLEYGFAAIGYAAKSVPYAGLNESLAGHVVGVLAVPWQTVRVVKTAGGAGGFEAGWDRLASAAGNKRVKLGWEDKDSFRERFCQGN